MKYFACFVTLLVSASASAQIWPGSTGEIGGHGYVDFELPSGLLWADRNLGAESVNDAGYLFAWGETQPRENFSWENYAHYIEFHLVYPEFPNCPDGWAILEDIGPDISGTEFDAAAKLWGNGWRMPTAEEADELRRVCEVKEVVEENDVVGYEIRYIHDTHYLAMFAPKGGAAWWCSTEDPDDFYINGDIGRVDLKPANQAKTFFVTYGGNGSHNKPRVDVWNLPKYEGNRIRPVYDAQNSGIRVISGKEDVQLMYGYGCIKVCGNDGDCAIEIADLSGRTIFTGVTKDSVCELPAIPGGIYIVSLHNGGKVVKAKKLVIR